MRALRILLIVVVVLGGLFVAADRIAVGFAEDKAADELRSNEDLSEQPDVSISGFPFLTQLASGELDDVQIRIGRYEASTTTDGGGRAKGGDTLLIEDLSARMKGVEFSDDYSSAKAESASGSARISYDELLKAAQIEPVDVAPGVRGKVVRLSDGGRGKIKVTVQATVLGHRLSNPLTVMSTMRVDDDVVKVHADTLPRFGSVPTPESRVRQITDFQQVIDGLPAGIHIAEVRAAPDGVRVEVTGSQVSLTG